MPYTLTLTPQDWQTIFFVGARYGWSAALMEHCRHSLAIEGCPEYDTCDGRETRLHTFTIPEHTAWELKEAFESDTEGGHSMFPMLQTPSALSVKLYEFLDRIV